MAICTDKPREIKNLPSVIMAFSRYSTDCPQSRFPGEIRSESWALYLGRVFLPMFWNLLPEKQRGQLPSWELQKRRAGCCTVCSHLMGNSNYCSSSWSIIKEPRFCARYWMLQKPVLFLALYDWVNVSHCQFNTCSVLCRKLYTYISLMLLAVNLSGRAVVHHCCVSDVWSKCFHVPCYILVWHKVTVQYTAGIGLPHNNKWFVAGSLEITGRLLAQRWIFRNTVSVMRQLCGVPVAFAERGGGCGTDARTGRALGKEVGAKVGQFGAGPPRLWVLRCVLSAWLGLCGLWRKWPAAGQALVCEYRK